MSTQDNPDEQIKPEKLSMILLEFLIKNPLDFWNTNEISRMASKKSLNNTRVKESISYFAKRNFVLQFSELSFDEQKKIKRDRVKEIISESYQITQEGIDVFQNSRITKNIFSNYFTLFFFKKLMYFTFIFLL